MHFSQFDNHYWRLSQENAIFAEPKISRLSLLLFDNEKSLVNEHSANSSMYNDGNPHSEVGSPAMSYRLDGLRRTAKSPASVTTAEEMSQNGDSLQEETQLELIDTRRVKFGDRTVETLTYKNGRNLASKVGGFWQKLNF